MLRQETEGLLKWQRGGAKAISQSVACVDECSCATCSQNSPVYNRKMNVMAKEAMKASKGEVGGERGWSCTCRISLHEWSPMGPQSKNDTADGEGACPTERPAVCPGGGDRVWRGWS